MQNKDPEEPSSPSKLKIPKVRISKLRRAATNLANNKPTLYTVMLAFAQFLVLYLIKYLNVCPNTPASDKL